MIKLFIVDDHPLFRLGIKAAFNAGSHDIYVVGEAGSGGELFRLLPSTNVDIILLDIHLPDISGIEIVYRLQKEYPSIKILAISAENTVETVKSLLEAGIDGFISKRQTGAGELTNAIQAIINGLEYFGRYISAIIYEIFVAKKKTTTVTDEFTGREKEIILACRDGLISKEIATRLGISTNTVNTHKKKIFQKLGINSTMEMVQYAIKKGIIRVNVN